MHAHAVQSERSGPEKARHVARPAQIAPSLQRKQATGSDPIHVSTHASVARQAKLRIGPAGNALEHEADRVAERAARAPDLLGHSIAASDCTTRPIFDATCGVVGAAQSSGTAHPGEKALDSKSSTERKIDDPPVLSWQTASGLATTNCGGFDWRVDWILDKSATEAGVIVQEVNHDAVFFDCKNVGTRYPYQYWELWSVKKGKTKPQRVQSGYDDAFRFVPNSVTPPKGRFSVTGYAQFYPGQNPAGFVPDSVRFAGALPARTSDPGLSGGTGKVTRSLKADWDCCPGSQDNKTHVVLS